MNPKPHPRTCEEVIPLRQRIRQYLRYTGSGHAHYKQMAKDIDCDERRVAHACHDMLTRGQVAHVWVSPTAYMPGVYRLPLEVVHD